MIKILEKDKDYLYVCTEEPEELQFVLDHFNVLMQVVHDGCEAAVVRKTKKSRVTT